MRRRERRRSHVSHERWLVSYADFITLLFAFFVVLYASSKADQKKQQQVSQAIDSAFHLLGLFPETTRNHPNLKNISAISDANPGQSPPSTNVIMNERVVAPAQVKEDLARVQKQLEKMLSTQIAEHTVSIAMGKDGLVISLREAGFFSSGSATPQPASLSVLRQIASTLGQTPYNVRIEGHTDNLPIHNSEFDSNWELSSARATRITRVFVDTREIPPDRLSAAGYAEYHPAANNNSEAGRAQNRRVDLVVMPRTQLNLAMPEGDASKATWHKVTD